MHRHGTEGVSTAQTIPEFSPQESCIASGLRASHSLHEHIEDYPQAPKIDLAAVLIMRFGGSGVRKLHFSLGSLALRPHTHTPPPNHPPKLLLRH